MSLRAPFAVLIAGAISLASLKFLPLPYVWAALGFAAAGLFLMRAAATEGMKALWLNLAVVAAALAAGEAYLGYTWDPRPTPSYSPNYQHVDDVLGPAPARSAVATSRLVGGGAPVYDVAYTIGPDGLRVAPPVSEPAKGSVLFFGCSFTFGEGLRDEESMPYRVGVVTNGRYQVRNFGFHGYGAHQMYSALASGRVAETIDRPATVVIYQAIPDHVARAAGLYPYQVNHPRFVLADDGSIVRKGRFSDDAASRPQSALATALLYQLRKSYILRLLIDRQRQPTDADERLWSQLVVRSRDLVAAQFPGAEFHVLMWSWVDKPSGRQKALVERMTSDLEAAGIAVHSVNDMLPDYDRDPTPYQLSPAYDRHPSAKANDLIAQYVVREILEKPPPRE